jgi:HAD superfamily hydrolase (TIGR01509 family)
MPDQPEPEMGAIQGRAGGTTRFRGVVFDMDGLIFDTERIAVEGWLAASRQLGLPISRDLVLQAVGRNAGDTRSLFVRVLGDRLDYDQARQACSAFIYATIEQEGVPLKPGLLALLAYLRRQGIQIALATSTAETRTRYLLDQAGIRSYFDQLVCGDHIARGKPEPDIYLAACSALALPPSDCLALEDSPAGIQSAHRAGLAVIMIPDLIRPDPGLAALLLARLATLADVIPLLETIFGGKQLI